MVIPERHQNNRVHIHGIFTTDLPKRWWKDNARACGMGFMAEKDAVYSAWGAGAYMGKYLFKQQQDTRWAKGFRRVRTSRQFPKLETLPRHPDWLFNAVAGHDAQKDAMDFLVERGWKVAMADHATAWALLDNFSELM